MNDTTPTPAAMVEEYIKLRNGKKEYERRAEELVQERFGKRMDELQGLLLTTLNNMGADSIKSASGTVHKIHNVSVTTEDQREWRRHVIGGELWDLLEWRPLKSAINELVEAGEPVPPGLKRSVFITVGVRKNT